MAFSCGIHFPVITPQLAIFCDLRSKNPNERSFGQNHGEYGRMMAIENQQSFHRLILSVITSASQESGFTAVLPIHFTNVMDPPITHCRMEEKCNSDNTVQPRQTVVQCCPSGTNSRPLRNNSSCVTISFSPLPESLKMKAKSNLVCRVKSVCDHACVSWFLGSGSWFLAISKNGMASRESKWPISASVTSLHQSERRAQRGRLFGHCLKIDWWCFSLATYFFCTQCSSLVILSLDVQSEASRAYFLGESRVIHRKEDYLFVFSLARLCFSCLHLIFNSRPPNRLFCALHASRYLCAGVQLAKINSYLFKDFIATKAKHSARFSTICSSGFQKKISLFCPQRSHLLFPMFVWWELGLSNQRTNENEQRRTRKLLVHFPAASHLASIACMKGPQAIKRKWECWNWAPAWFPSAVCFWRLRHFACIDFLPAEIIFMHAMLVGGNKWSRSSGFTDVGSTKDCT